MGTTVADVMAILEAWAPPAWAEPWDNVGLQVGAPDRPAGRILVALEVTDAVLAEALAAGADLLVVHHPVIFRPLKALRWDSGGLRRLEQAVRAGLSIYAAHTNLDVAPGGTNDTLAQRLGLQDPAVLAPAAGDPARGHGRVGHLAAPCTLGQLAAAVQAALGAHAVRVAGDRERVVTRVAVSAGSGGAFIAAAARAGAQVLVAGDIDHHDAWDALDLGLCVVDPGHFATEQPVVEQVVRRLRQGLADRGLEAWVQAAGAGRDPFAPAG